MQEKEAKNRIEQLRAVLTQYGENYYKGEGVASDSEYDYLYKELQQLEEQFPLLKESESPTQQVGASLSNKFEHKVHSTAMYSLSNQYGEDDLTQWYERLANLFKQETLSYVCELKIDGVSLSLVYENGILEEALTRGNGKIGDIITDNVKDIIEGVPLHINTQNRMVIRGEVYLTKKQFANLNKEKEEKQQELFKNSRNTVAGSLQVKNPDLIRNRGLCFFAYEIAEGDAEKEHCENLLLLEKYGFVVNPNRALCKNLQEILQFCQQWTEEKKQSLPFDIDGVVIKLNSLTLRNDVGFTAKFPRWATAWKFKAQQEQSRLLFVKHSVGRTGVITPVAYIEPVSLGGTQVQRASLYNYDQIEKLNLCEDDFVVVEKGGEIIPKVVGIVYEARKGEHKPIVAPLFCPVCETSLEKQEDEVALRCTNQECPAILKGKIEFFVSKNAMDIQTLGPQIIAILFEQKFLQHIGDIYTLKNKKEEIEAIEGLGKKSVEQLLYTIEQSKTPELGRFILALAIRYIGSVSATIIAKNCRTLANFRKLKAEDIEQINGLGPVICESLRQWLCLEENQKLIDFLLSQGVTPQEVQEQEDTFFVGEKIVLTGTLQESRTIWKNRLEQLGFQVVSAISAKTDYLLVGANPGSKQKKARDLGIPVIEEEIAKKLGETIQTKEDIINAIVKQETND